jgi:hypothetical protein
MNDQFYKSCSCVLDTHCQQRMLLMLLTDCSFEDLSETGASECSPYNNHYLQLRGQAWVVAVATLVMGGMGLAVGGNDVANAW